MELHQLQRHAEKDSARLLLHNKLLSVNSSTSDEIITINTTYKMKAIELPTHAVRSSRYFYGTKTVKGIAFVGALDECKEFIRRDAERIYYTSHNEAGRWSLRIVTTNSLSPSARRDAEQRAYEQSW